MNCDCSRMTAIRSSQLATRFRSGQDTTLSVSPTTVQSGGTVTAAWSGIAMPTPADWIGLYVPGSYDSTFFDWIYVSCSKSPDSPRASGSCPFTMPSTLSPGAYQLRLFANNSTTLLAGSNGFTVGLSPGVLQFSAATYSVAENGGNATITISRSGGNTGAVAVTFATSNGTATQPSDYTAVTQTVSFANGDTANKTVSIPIVNDAAVEARRNSQPGSNQSHGRSDTRKSQRGSPDHYKQRLAGRHLAV